MSSPGEEARCGWWAEMEDNSIQRQRGSPSVQENMPKLCEVGKNEKEKRGSYTSMNNSEWWASWVDVTQTPGSRFDFTRDRLSGEEKHVVLKGQLFLRSL